MVAQRTKSSAQTESESTQRDCWTTLYLFLFHLFITLLRLIKQVPTQEGTFFLYSATHAIINTYVKKNCSLQRRTLLANLLCMIFFQELSGSSSSSSSSSSWGSSCCWFCVVRRIWSCSSRRCLRHLARRFLNQTCHGQDKKKLNEWTPSCLMCEGRDAMGTFAVGTYHSFHLLHIRFNNLDIIN